MSQKRVLLVVRADDPQDPKRQLEWLEQNIFPFWEYPRRRLAYVGALSYVHKMTDPWKYDAFDDFEDLYSKLRGEGYFVNTFREPRHFDFALLIHIRQDFSSGMGYGLEERRGERCLLRAMFLAARGNVLFGDWGLPMGTLPDVTREQLLKGRVLSQYIYTKVSYRRYPDLVPNVPFTKVIDHFLTPVYEADPCLPPEHMNRIKQATNGTLFTEYQLKLAIWNAWWNLYFAKDAYWLVYHRWIHFRYFKMEIVHVYLYFRRWSVSSDWLEICIDSCGFVVMSLVYGILALFYIACLDSYNNATTVEEEWRTALTRIDPLHFVIGSVLRYAWWMAFVMVFFKIFNGTIDDRIPIWIKLKSFLRYAIFLPMFDVWFHTWLSRDSRMRMDFVLVWISFGLADLVTHWFFVPFHRNCVAFALLGLVTAGWMWQLPDLPILARWMLEQGLWFIPFFVRGRLRLHRELKRSFLYMSWIASASILLLQYLTVRCIDCLYYNAQ